MKNNKKKNTGNEEIQAIMDEIKNAQPKEDANLTIDTDQVQKDGTTIHEHEETANGVTIHTREVKPAEGANKAPQAQEIAKVGNSSTDMEKAPKIEDMAVIPPTEDALQFYNLIMDGHDINSLREMYKGWKLKRINKAYQKAQELIQVAQKEQEQARAEAVARYNYMYRAASKVGNLKEMRAIQDCICKVQGLWKDGISVGENAQVITLWGGLGAAPTNK